MATTLIAHQRTIRWVSTEPSILTFISVTHKWITWPQPFIRGNRAITQTNTNIPIAIIIIIVASALVRWSGDKIVLSLSVCAGVYQKQWKIIGQILEQEFHWWKMEWVCGMRWGMPRNQTIVSKVQLGLFLNSSMWVNYQTKSRQSGYFHSGELPDRAGVFPCGNYITIQMLVMWFCSQVKTGRGSKDLSGEALE